MSYYDKAKKLKSMGVSPKNIPAILGYFNGDCIEIQDETLDELYDYYLNSGEMPYGTAKARDGDPYNWIINQLENELGFNTKVL